MAAVNVFLLNYRPSCQEKENWRNWKPEFLCCQCLPFVTVDWRQNPDRTLVRGTRISGYRKLQCDYYKLQVCQTTHSHSGVRKRSKNCCVSCLFFGLFSSTPREAHSEASLTPHSHTNSVSGNIRRGSVSGCRENGRKVNRLGLISRVSGGAPPRPDRNARPPLTRLGLIRIYWPEHCKVWGELVLNVLCSMILYPTISFLFYLAESSRSLSIEGKWDDLPLDRRLSLQLRIFL